MCDRIYIDRTILTFITSIANALSSIAYTMFATIHFVTGTFCFYSSIYSRIPTLIHDIDREGRTITADIPTIAHTLTFKTHAISITIIIVVTVPPAMNVVSTARSDQDILIQPQLTIWT